MVMLAQVIPFSLTGIVSILIQIVFNTITTWLSAQFVVGNVRLQNALIFATVTYFVIYFLVFIPIPSLPIINTVILIEAIIKSLLAMKLFNTDFRGGICIAGVQILFGTIIRLSF